MSPDARRFLAVGIVFAAALSIRLVNVAELRHTLTFEAPLVDARTYDREARRIAESGPAALEVPYYQPPAYPMLLGAVYALSSGSATAPRIVQAVLGSATVAMVFLLGCRLAGKRAGVIAAAFLAVYGPVLYFEGDLLPPSWILLLNTAALLLLSGGSPPATAALLLGISTAIRPTSALLAAGCAVWWWRRAGAPRGRKALLAAAAFVAPILPFTVANVVGGRAPVLLSTNAGINLYLGNGAGSDSLVAIQPGYAWERLQLEPLLAGRPTREASAYWTERALREASADPAAWAASLGRKALRLLDRRETPRNTDWEAFRRDSRLLSLPLPGFGLVFPFAVVGLALGGPGRRVRTLLVLALAAVALENLGFFVAGRYRLAAVPALCVLGGAGIQGLLRPDPRSSRRRALALGAAAVVVVHADFLGERGIDEARVSIQRGHALQYRGLIESAGREFTAALRHAPDHPDAHRGLGEVALARGTPETALFHFDRALASAPDCVRVMLARAQALERLERTAEAEAGYREALRVDPWSNDARLNYGVFLALRGRREEARHAFESGLRNDPGDERLARNLELLDGGS